MFLKSGILLSSFSIKQLIFGQVCYNNIPVIRIIINNKIIPDPGIVVSKLKIASGRYSLEPDH